MKTTTKTASLADKTFQLAAQVVMALEDGGIGGNAGPNGEEDSRRLFRDCIKLVTRHLARVARTSYHEIDAQVAHVEQVAEQRGKKTPAVAKSKP